MNILKKTRPYLDEVHFEGRLISSEGDFRVWVTFSEVFWSCREETFDTPPSSAHFKSEFGHAAIQS